MDDFEALATTRDEDGSLLFLAYTLDPETSRPAAERYSGNHVGLPESASAEELLDVAMGLYVLRALGIDERAHGRRRFSRGALAAKVDAALAAYGFGEVFGFVEPEDEEDLVDAVVWLYVFERAGLSAFREHRPRVAEALAQRRAAYPAHKGTRAWAWTCYLVTHVVYVRSGWGLEPPQPCEPERAFILANMARALASGDLEIIGEFCHCLRILGAHHPLLAQARELLAHSRPPKSGTLYRRYHTNWCIAVGKKP